MRCVYVHMICVANAVDACIAAWQTCCVGKQLIYDHISETFEPAMHGTRSAFISV